MNEELTVLQSVLNALEQLGYKAVINQNERQLLLFDGKLTIKTEVHHDEGMHPSIAHVHVVGMFDKFPKSKLDACVIGVDKDFNEALKKAGSNWVTTAGSVILSLCNAKAVGEAAHFSGKEAWGVEGSHGFAGPIVIRSLDSGSLNTEAIAQVPLFENVAELTPGGMIHLAKVTLSQNKTGGWKRQLEIDGHEAGYVDEEWQLGIPAPESGTVIISRFAIYHHADQEQLSKERLVLDDTIRVFFDHLKDNPEGDPNNLSPELIKKGHRADLLFWLDSFASMVASRVILSDLHVRFADSYYLAGVGGEIRGPLKLMKNPVYARCLVLAQQYVIRPEYQKAMQRAAMCSSEFNAINSALNSGSKPENLSMLPTLVPDMGTSQRDVDLAMDRYMTLVKQAKESVIKKPKKGFLRGLFGR